MSLKSMPERNASLRKHMSLSTFLSASPQSQRIQLEAQKRWWGPKSRHWGRYQLGEKVWVASIYYKNGGGIRYIDYGFVQYCLAHGIGSIYIFIWNCMEPPIETPIDSFNMSTATKLLGVACAAIGVNYLIAKQLKSKQQTKAFDPKVVKEGIEKEKENNLQLRSSRNIPPNNNNKQLTWGVFLVRNFEEGDDLLKELDMMDKDLFEVSRINHIIVDNGYDSFKTFPCPLICKGFRHKRNEPFLSKAALITPGQFVIKQCVFTPGRPLELEKKFLRAGPRATQFFNPADVHADIVCLGKVCPGMNTMIRELVLVLNNVYQVKKVTGVKDSFKGYYDNNFIELTPALVETIHHQGGCFIGLCRTELDVKKIVESLVQRKVNQVYLIGANATLKAEKLIYGEIKRRKLPIAMTVILKGIHRDVPIFDGCFGFETAVEESSIILQKAYEFSHATFHGVSLVKLPGFKSGFLAASTVLSTINANFCLVPEFPFDLNGKKGLLQNILNRLKTKGSCTIVYSDGAEHAVRDCCVMLSKNSFDSFLRNSIEEMLKAENMAPYQIGFFDGIEIARSSPANSIDTKLCCQIALSSIMGLMNGFTNFATGHLANINALISVDELINSEIETNLRYHQELWQRVRMATGQPSLLNDQ